MAHLMTKPEKMNATDFVPNFNGALNFDPELGSYVVRYFFR